MDVKNGWRIFRRDRYKHASPNSAQTESVCAGLLDVRLAGDAWYHGVLHKKEYIGDALRQIEHEDIPRACRLMYGATLLADSAGGYVLVGVASFTAAAVLTVVCMRLHEREKREKNNKTDKEGNAS